jgi:hypothetical protein
MLGEGERVTFEVLTGRTVGKESSDRWNTAPALGDKKGSFEKGCASAKGFGECLPFSIGKLSEALALSVGGFGKEPALFCQRAIENASPFLSEGLLKMLPLFCRRAHKNGCPVVQDTCLAKPSCAAGIGMRKKINKQ